MTYSSDISVQLSQSAFHGTSMSPERRGDGARQEYDQTLIADLVTMQSHGVRGGTADQVAEEFDRYRAGMRRRYSAWLSSESRCVSSFIAGPSNFPAHRMNKRADVAHRRMGEYLQFRETALKAAIRNLRPDLRPIMAGDDNAVSRLTAEIAQAEGVQANMKAANAAIRKAKTAGPAAQVAALVALGFPESRAFSLLKPDFCGRIGFADYETTNNSANIRRMKARLCTISAAKETPNTEIQGTNATLEDCPADNRVRLTFPGKPSEEIRAKLKSNGFRWTPSLGVWQAYRKQWSMDLARQIAGVTA